MVNPVQEDIQALPIVIKWLQNFINYLKRDTDTFQKKSLQKQVISLINSLNPSPTPNGGLSKKSKLSDMEKAVQIVDEENKKHLQITIDYQKEIAQLKKENEKLTVEVAELKKTLQEKEPPQKPIIVIKSDNHFGLSQELIDGINHKLSNLNHHLEKLRNEKATTVELQSLQKLIESLKNVLTPAEMLEIIENELKLKENSGGMLSYLFTTNECRFSEDSLKLINELKSKLGGELNDELTKESKENKK